MDPLLIIDYSAGNLRSVENAFRRLGVEPAISGDPERIRQAAKVILPGVGHARHAMDSLRENQLDKLIPGLKQPLLGICLGLQLLCEHSEEGDTDCLGVFPAEVRKFSDVPKVPHMGWNQVRFSDSRLGKGLSDEWFYFVHGYFAENGNQTTGTAEYGKPFSAVMEQQNFYACQFHPEKSAAAGEKLLQNFLEL